MSEATRGKPRLGPFMKFALVDMEHGPVGRNELYAAVPAAERGVGLIAYGSDLNVFMAGAAWLRREAGLEPGGN